MKRCLTLSGLLALGILFGASAGVADAAQVHYDAYGRPYVVVYQGNKPIRYYCRKGFYNQVQCPTPRSHLRFGPYDRDFAFSQGYQILR